MALLSFVGRLKRSVSRWHWLVAHRVGSYKERSHSPVGAHPVGDRAKRRVGAHPVGDRAKRRVGAHPVGDRAKRRVGAHPVGDRAKRRVGAHPVGDRAKRRVGAHPVGDRAKRRPSGLPVALHSIQDAVAMALPRIKQVPVALRGKDRQRRGRPECRARAAPWLPLRAGRRDPARADAARHAR